MKKIVFLLVGCWLLIAFGSPLFLAPLVEKELKSLRQYPEIIFLDAQRSYFSSRIHLKFAKFGQIRELEENIIYSPFLFSGLNWLKLEGQQLTGQVNLIGNIQLKLGEFLWQSHLSNPKKGELTTQKSVLPLSSGKVELESWRAMLDLEHKTFHSNAFVSKIIQHGKSYPISGKNLSLLQNGKNLDFQIAELTFSVGKILDLEGTISLAQNNASASFIPKLPFPLTAFNKQILKMHWTSPILEIRNKGNDKNLYMNINFQEKNGIIRLNSDFVKRSGLALILKYQFGEIPDNLDNDLILSIHWNEKGVFIHNKLLITF